MYKTILVPLDGSELAASILDQVGTLAQGYGARLILMTVGPTLPTSLSRARDIQLTLTFQAEAYLERIRDALVSRGLSVETIVRIGDPADEILEMATHQKIDLIMITSRGGEGASSPFLGSVAAKVAGASTIPVFVFNATVHHEQKC